MYAETLECLSTTLKHATYDLSRISEQLRRYLHAALDTQQLALAVQELRRVLRVLSQYMCSKASDPKRTRRLFMQFRRCAEGDVDLPVWSVVQEARDKLWASSPAMGRSFDSFIRSSVSFLADLCWNLIKCLACTSILVENWILKRGSLSPGVWEQLEKLKPIMRLLDPRFEKGFNSAISLAKLH